MLSYVTKIKNTNGQPMETNFNRWLKDHSPHFKSLKLSSLLDARAWCQCGRFKSNIALVSELAERKLVAEVSGESENEQKKKSKSSDSSTGASTLTDGQKFLLDKRKDVLSASMQQLCLHVEKLAVPLGQRCLELDVRDPKNGGDEINPKFIQISVGCTMAAATDLFALLTPEKLSRVMEGKASLSFMNSPVKPPTSARCHIR